MFLVLIIGVLGCVLAIRWKKKNFEAKTTSPAVELEAFRSIVSEDGESAHLVEPSFSVDSKSDGIDDLLDSE